MHHRPIFLIALFCSFSIGTLRATEPSSLVEIERRILQQNPAICQAKAEWEATKERIPQAAAWEDPKISMTQIGGRFVNVSKNAFTDQSVSFEQTIPLTGKNRVHMRIFVAQAAIVLEKLRRKELDAISEVRSVFYKILSLQNLLALNQASDVLLKRATDNNLDLLSVGTQSQNQVLAAVIDYSKNTEARKDLEEQLSQAQSRFNLLLNRDPFTAVAPFPENQSPIVFEQNLNSLRQILFANRPEIRMAEAQVAIARLQADLAKREWLPDPTVSLGGQRYNAAAQVVSEITIGVSISLPWLNAPKYRAGEKETANDLAAAQAGLDQARLEGLALLRDALQTIATANHHREIYHNEILPKARQSLEANQSAYQNSRTTYQELVRSQNQVIQLTAEARMHRAEYETAIAQLDAVIGSGISDITNQTLTSSK